MCPTMWTARATTILALTLGLVAVPSAAKAFTAVCKPVDRFAVDLARREILPPNEYSSAAAEQLIEGFAAVNAPSGVVISFDETRVEGTIIFEGVFRSQGSVLDVTTDEHTGSTAVYYSTGPGATDYIQIARSGDDHLLFWTSQSFPRLTIYQFGCDVS